MEQTIQRVKPEEFREAAHLIALLNREPAHHIGFCGTNEEEVYQTLLEDFTDGQASSLVAASGADGMQALIGLDIDEDSAEVWGPFSVEKDSAPLHQLWEMLSQQYPAISKYLFFINEQNIRQLAFAEEIGARKTGEHLILEASKESVPAVAAFTNRQYEEADFERFEEIHDKEFPATYYDAATIVERIRSSEHNALKVVESDGKVQAYAYYEINAISNEAHLEYIAVHPDARGKGIGTVLLKEILAEIFQYDGIDELLLTVENGNDHANHVYFKAGFREKAKLWSFRLHQGNEDTLS